MDPSTSLILFLSVKVLFYLFFWVEIFMIQRFLTCLVVTYIQRNLVVKFVSCDIIDFHADDT